MHAMKQQKEPKGLRASVLRWLGVPIEATSGAFWSAYYNSTNSAGQVVNEKTILGLSAAYACTRLISESVGTLPFKVYRKTKDGREPANNHPVYSLIADAPNAYSTPAQFWSAFVSSMLLWGNGFAKIQRIAGRVVSLTLIHPATIKPNIDAETGTLKGYVRNITASKSENLSVDSVFHVAAFGTDGRWGLSAISYGASVFGSAMAGANAANGTFERGLSPTVALKIDHVIKPEQRDQFRAAMEAIGGAMNSGRTAVLEAGMDAKQIGINPRDAQLLESRSFSAEEVCSWFGVDPSMIGRGTAVSNWGTGLEQKNIGFLTYTINPILIRIAQAVNRQFLTDPYYSEHTIEGLLRADSSGRASFYSTMVNLGVMTRDEVRVKENMSATGGNSAKQTIQLGFTTLDKLGEQNESV